MARLILLNGPPGIGKSTVARHFIDVHPMALCLDIDLIRSLLGRWQGDPEVAGLRARALALEMARDHLVAGHDVIVPQLLARLPFIESLERLAAETGAELHELVLLDERPRAVERFVERSRRRSEQGEPDEAGAAIETVGGAEALEATYDRLLALVDDRSRAIRVTATEGDVEGTLAAVMAAMGEELEQPDWTVTPPA